jgi:hypothetical protein
VTLLALIFIISPTLLKSQRLTGKRRVMALVDEVSVLVDLYTEYQQKRISLQEVGNRVAISTPFMDGHNDGLVIYVAKVSDDEYLLTDDGEIMIDLEQSGCSFNTPSKKQFLDNILLTNGVRLENGELKVETTAREFAVRKSNLLMAMMELNRLSPLHNN